LYSDSNSLRDTLVFQFRSIKWNYIAGSGDAFVRITQQNCLYPLHLGICLGSSFQGSSFQASSFLNSLFHFSLQYRICIFSDH